MDNSGRTGLKWAGWADVREVIPTDRLPTIAIFLCFGAAGILSERWRCGDECVSDDEVIGVVR